MRLKNGWKCSNGHRWTKKKQCIIVQWSIGHKWIITPEVHLCYQRLSLFEKILDSWSYYQLTCNNWKLFAQPHFRKNVNLTVCISVNNLKFEHLFFPLDFSFGPCFMSLCSKYDPIQTWWPPPLSYLLTLITTTFFVFLTLITIVFSPFFQCDYATNLTWDIPTFT